MEIKDNWYSAEYDTSDGIVIYDFEITELKEKGWVECRMVGIQRQYTDGSIVNVYYNPNIHDNTNHYMGYPYTARYNSKKHILKVFKGDGTLFYAKGLSRYIAK